MAARLEQPHLRAFPFRCQGAGNISPILRRDGHRWSSWRLLLRRTSPKQLLEGLDLMEVVNERQY
jgi:hypothetical protein